MSPLPSHIKLMRTVLREMATPSEPTFVSPQSQTSVMTQPVGKMLMAARAISAFETPEAVRALVAPMTVTALVHEDNELRGHFHSASDAIFAAISDSVGADLMTDLHVVALELSSSRYQHFATERFQNGIDEALVRGKSVLAVTSDASQLSETARALLSRSYTLPPIDACMIAEVMRALGRAPSGHLAARLSAQDTAIARLPAAVAIGALRLDDPESTVRIILEAVRRLDQPAGSGPKLKDLYLSKDLGTHFAGIVQDIALWRDGKLAWEDVSCSTLLYGPPGNGKTSIARALAGTAQLHYVSGSYAEAQAAGSMSHYLQAMEARAAEAISNVPSLFFVDELDSLPDRSFDHGNNDSYMTSVVNHALELFTRLHRTPGVVLLAASNHLSKIDPALIRAGRLDTHLYVGPPSRTGIEAILRKRLSSNEGTLDLRAASRWLVGMSGADVTTAATKAIAIARRAGRQVVDDDLLNAIDRPASAGFDQQVNRIALHEAGHAVVGAAVGLPLPSRIVVSPGKSHVASAPPSSLRLLDVEQLMATLLGGRAAEMLLLGDASSGAETDIAQATSLALSLETRICLDAAMPMYLPYDPTKPERWPAELHDAVRKRMADAQVLAFQAVQANTKVVRNVAEALVSERELDASQLEPLLRPVTSVPPASKSHSCKKEPRLELDRQIPVSE